jgi:hypothetical protein
VKRDRVEAWLQAEFPGETLRAYATGGPGNGESSDSRLSYHPASLQAQIEARGLDRTQRVGLGHRSIVAVLTDHRLAITGVGGAFRVKPKGLLHESAPDRVACVWWDNDEGARPNLFRNLILRFDDGHWAGIGAPKKLLGKTVAGDELSKELIAALGDRATHVDWRGAAPR